MQPTYTRAPLVGLALACALGCGRERATVADGPTIEITADDALTTRAVVDGPRPMTSMLTAPPSSWLEVIATSHDDRTLELTRPATTYPDAELRVYLDQGRPAFGVFRRPTADMPREIAEIVKQPIVSLTNLAAIHVRTRPLPRTPIVVRVDGVDHPIADRLAELPRPRGASPRDNGWLLTDVIHLAVPAERALRTVRLHHGPKVMPLDVATASSPHARLKQNQRGEYVFRMWDIATRQPPQLEARGVTKIEIE